MKKIILIVVGCTFLASGALHANHEHQIAELKAKLVAIEAEHKETLNAAQKVIVAEKEKNQLLVTQLNSTWGWKSKVYVVAISLAIGWLSATQSARANGNAMRGAITSKQQL